MANTSTLGLAQTLPETIVIVTYQQTPFGIGSSPRRKEDARLLRGDGLYIADTVIAGEVNCVFVRSNVARGDIIKIHTNGVASLKGVLAVLTGEHLHSEGLGSIPWEVRPPLSPETRLNELPSIGAPSVAPPQPLMAFRRVRFVGEIVAMVVAETLNLAMDAAELVRVEYDQTVGTVDINDATAAGAAPVWGAFPNNVAFAMSQGDSVRTGETFEKAYHVAKLRIVNQRIFANPIETRGAIGLYNPGTGRYTLYTPAGKPHPLRNTLADDIFHIPRSKIHVVVGDIGGGFGAKNVTYPEHGLVLWAARRVGKPVKWVQDRIEAAQSDMQARDQLQDVELALDENHRFTGLRVRARGNLGAYLAPRGVNPPTLHRLILPSVYQIGAIHLEVEGIYSNTAPTCSTRGAGAPECIFMLERVIDTAAYELNVDPIELRRLNIIPERGIPYKTVFGQEYDSGQFSKNMDRALTLINWKDFPARREDAKQNGKLRGMALANLLEVHGFGISETAELRVDEKGRTTVYIGTQSSGQSHETVYAQIVATVFGSRLEDISVVQGDTDVINEGNGTGASRSIIVGGSALLQAAEKVVEKGRSVASHLLEAARADIEFDAGTFRVTGTDRVLSFAEIAAAAHNRNLFPDTVSEGWGESDRFNPDAPTYPNGCHICEVEVDPDTGKVEIIGYAMVQDSGVLINPVIVQGQLHGGVAYGIGQALMEDGRCDRANGQVVRATFMDYAMPRADDMPSFGLETVLLPCPNNPLGVKACGESGTVGPPPAIVAAIVDALKDSGVRDIEMPATPETVWRTIRDAGTRTHTHTDLRSALQ